MSKEAGLRAMREARYRERSAGSPPSTTASRPTSRPAPVRVVADPPADVLCGHRSMNGRTCTREQGHAAKSHRYS